MWTPIGPGRPSLLNPCNRQPRPDSRRILEVIAVRPTRNLLLLTLLIAAIAAQRIVAHPAGRLPATAPELTQVARALVRRINRRETKPATRAWLIAPRLAGARLRLLARRLFSAVFEPPTVSPFLFRLPPPLAA